MRATVTSHSSRPVGLACYEAPCPAYGAEKPAEHAQLASVEQAVKVDRLGQYFELSFAAAPSFAELQLKFPNASQEQLAVARPRIHTSLGRRSIYIRSGGVFH